MLIDVEAGGIMNNKNLIFEYKKIIRPISFALGAILLIGLAGCSGRYGNFKMDKEVLYAFENNTVNTEYKYFSNYQHNVTFAILGIESKYKLESEMWREVEPDTEDFNKMVNALWEDWGRYKYGASVLDPDGNKVGIWYSAVFGKAIKFLEDNQIEVLIDTPYLWGPEIGGGGGSIPMNP